MESPCVHAAVVPLLSCSWLVCHCWQLIQECCRICSVSFQSTVLTPPCFQCFWNLFMFIEKWHVLFRENVMLCHSCRWSASLQQQRTVTGTRPLHFSIQLQLIQLPWTPKILVSRSNSQRTRSSGWIRASECLRYWELLTPITIPY